MHKLRLSMINLFRYGLRGLAIAMALASAACNVGENPVGEGESKVHKEAPDQHEELSRGLQAALNQAIEEKGYPGATLALVLPDNTLLSIASGFDDLEQGIKMRPDSRLMSGSTGKSFAAAVALSLAVDGVIGLDDKVSKWLGDEPWYQRLPNGQDITVRMLLQHTTGIEDYLADPDFHRAAVPLFQDKASMASLYFSPAELVAFKLNDPASFAAGARHWYSDTGYILAGLVIEKATGRTFYEELTDRFLKPLGLQSTEPAVGLEYPGLAAGYVNEDNPFGLGGLKIATDGVLLLSPATEWTGGGLVTSSVDLAHWAKLLYEGRAMKGDYLGELLDSVASKPQNPASRYGLGVSIRETPAGTEYGHGGWFFGYVSHMSYYPEHQLAAAIQINTDVSDSAKRAAMRALLDDLAEIAVDYLARSGEGQNTSVN